MRILLVCLWLVDQWVVLQCLQCLLILQWLPHLLQWVALQWVAHRLIRLCWRLSLVAVVLSLQWAAVCQWVASLVVAPMRRPFTLLIMLLVVA